jgi:hypothetical protein
VAGQREATRCAAPAVSLLALLVATSWPHSEGLAADWYLRGGLGLSAAAAAGTFGAGTFHDESLYGHVVTERTLPLSLGEGFNLEAAGGLTVTEGLALEVGVSWLAGASFVATKNEDGDQTVATLSGSALGFTPAAVLSRQWGALRGYARVGGVLALPEATLVAEATSPSPTPMVSKGETLISGNVAWGLHAAAGLEVSAWPGGAVYGELAFTSLSWRPARATVVAASQNGVDVLPQMTTWDKETEFSDEYTVDLGASPNEGLPDTHLAPNIPFSSAGVRVGVRIGF